MPLYEYHCEDCKTAFDLLRPFSRADAPAACPRCHGERSRRAPSRCAAFSRGSDGATAAVAGGGGCSTCGGGSCAGCGH